MCHPERFNYVDYTKFISTLIRLIAINLFNKFAINLFNIFIIVIFYFSLMIGLTNTLNMIHEERKSFSLNPENGFRVLNCTYVVK